METRSFFPVGNMALYLVTISLLMALSAYIWQFRKIAGANEQIKNQIAKICWLLSLLMIGYSRTVDEKILWHRIYLLSEIFSPYYWLFFISGISRQNIPNSYKYLIRTIAFYLIILVLTDSWLHTMEFPVWLQNGVFYVKENWGGLFLALYSYGLCIATIYLILRWIYTAVGLQRKQALWFGLAGLWIIPVLVIKEILRSNLLDPLPIGFSVIAIFTAWGFYRWRIYDVVSLAWKTSVHQMYEGLIVIDEYNYIVEMNPTGTKILQDFLIKRGDSYQKLLASWPVLHKLEKKKIVEEKCVIENNVKYYEIQQTDLEVRGHFLGKVLIFKNITERELIQQKLIGQEKALSVLKERNRLGRELHDGPGQVWGYVTMQIEAADRWLEKNQVDKARIILAELLQNVQDVHIDMRESITGLKCMQPEQGDFIDSLQKYLNWFEKTYPIVVSIEQDLQGDTLSSIAKVQLLRIIQEILTNIRKHTKATDVNIRFHHTSESVFCEIEDNGAGFDFKTDEKPGHFGLDIIRERIAEIDGSIKMKSTVPHGTIVMIEVHGKAKECDSYHEDYDR